MCLQGGDGGLLGLLCLDVGIALGIVGGILDSLFQVSVGLFCSSLALVKKLLQFGHFLLEVHTAGINLCLQIIDVVIIIATRHECAQRRQGGSTHHENTDEFFVHRILF